MYGTIMINFRNVGLFDMDGSLAAYVEALVRDMNLLSSPGEVEITIENLYSLDKHEYIRNRMRVIKHQPGWWLNLKPIEAGMKAVIIANSLGFENHILTKGPKKISNAWKEKVEWCQKYIGEDVDIHITSDKGLMYGKFLYDDYPVYMDNWLQFRPNGLGIMPITPYNKDYNHPNVLMWDGQNIDQIVNAMKIAYNRQPNEKLDLKALK